MVRIALTQSLAKAPVSVSKWWVACSGGLDSLVLLHALAHLPRTIPIVAIYIHHGLQADADLWEEAVRTACRAWEVPFEVRHLKLGSLQRNIEATARKARYAAFESLLGEGEVVLTAHHQDDQAETMLLKILRGMGVHGLAGIRPWRPLGKGYVGRPFLTLSRKQLADYAASHRLQWSTDTSNASDAFDRNYLRNQLFPVLEARFPGNAGAWARASEWCARASSLLDEQAQEDIGPITSTLSWSILSNKSLLRQDNALRYWISQQGVALPTQGQLAELLRQLQHICPGKGPVLIWAQGRIRYFAGTLYFDADRKLPSYPEDWDQSFPVLLRDGRWLQTLPEAWVGWSLSLRYRAQLEGSDRAQFKVHMQSQQIPPWLRDQVPLLYNAGVWLSASE